MKLSIFILIVSTLSLTANASPTNLKNRRLALGASSNNLDKRRFGVEHTPEADATFQDVKDIAQGTDKEAQAGNLSGAMVRALLAKAPACDQQDRADEVIDLGDQLGGDKRTQLVKVAQTYRQLERNTPNAGQPSELCNKQPRHKELDGLVQAQDPTGNNQDPTGNNPQNSTENNDPTQNPNENNNSTQNPNDPTQNPNGNSTSAYPDMPKGKKGKGKDKKKGKGKDKKKGKGKDKKKGKGKKDKGKGKESCKKMNDATDASNNQDNLSNNGTGLDNGADASNNGTDSSNNDCKKMKNGCNNMDNSGKMMDNGTMNNPPNNGSDPSSNTGKKNKPNKGADPSKSGADPSANVTDPSTNGTDATTNPTSDTGNKIKNDAVTNPVAGVPMPPIIQDKTSNRPFSVNGDTFVNLGAAQKRQCDVQHNGCANAVNNGTAPQGTTVGDCDTQTGVCNAGQPLIQQKQN